MMKRPEKTCGTARQVLTAAIFLGAVILLCPAASVYSADLNFDSKGHKIFSTYDNTPTSYMSSDSGGRTLLSFYELRQYPGSPPRIPHPVEPSFSDAAPDCLSCHKKGGFSPVHNAFIPVTPHPELESCQQCHVPKPKDDKAFKGNDWVSVSPPRLGGSAMGGSPPVIPHSLQLRENCISCHTGPAAVVEIRVEHSARGNCRQCHVPLLQTEPVMLFTRKKE